MGKYPGVMVGQMSSLWWIWLVTGILWVIISLVILQFRTTSITTVGIIIGVMFLAAGVQNLAFGFLAEGWKWLWILFGVVFIIAGIVALSSPKDTVSAFADVLGFLFLVFGIFWTVEAFSVRATNQLWWMLLIAGLMMVALAFWTGTQYHITKVYTLLAFSGAWALLHGITDMIRAFEIKKVGKLMAS
jgi:uncharacterized membrane protein HdeD (DUF308 family)